MKFEGTVTRWDDAKGFGFIVADGSESPIFFHLSDCTTRSPRPEVGRRVAFDVNSGAKGKHALRIEYVSSRATRQRLARRAKPAKRPPLWPLIAFVLLWLALGVFAAPPAWALPVYAGTSALTFVVYALDKSAAHRGSWRTQESTLHGLALACGWPGALLAQRMLRHKSSKTEFQSVFRTTALVNVVAFVAVSLPWLRGLLLAA